MMPRVDKATARRQFALDRPELRTESVPRVSASGVTSHAVKVNAFAGLIAAYKGKLAVAEGLALVNEQIARLKP